MILPVDNKIEGNELEPTEIPSVRGLPTLHPHELSFQKTFFPNL